MGEDDYFNTEESLAELLLDEVLFANGRKYVNDVMVKPGEETIEPETVVLFVVVNDVFYWACADAEPLPLREVEPLYKLWKEKGYNGVVEWACIRRGMRPQTPIERDMRKAGAWPEALEALPPRDPKECG